MMHAQKEYASISSLLILASTKTHTIQQDDSQDKCLVVKLKYLSQISCIIYYVITAICALESTPRLLLNVRDDIRIEVSGEYV